jgi:hypothetical protein
MRRLAVEKKCFWQNICGEISSNIKEVQGLHKTDAELR